MQKTMTAGQAAPLIVSMVRAIEDDCRGMLVEMAWLRNSVTKWARAHREELEDCVAVPALTAFGVVMYLMVAVLQGGAV